MSDAEMKELQELIPAYILNKSEADDYKKIADKLNKKIKVLMASNNIEEYMGVKYSVRTSESINEPKLLQIIKQDSSLYNLCLHDLGVVKTKEYIDFDALESAIYNEKISSDIVIKFKEATEIKEVPTLTISKRKKNKEEDN